MKIFCNWLFLFLFCAVQIVAQNKFVVIDNGLPGWLSTQLRPSDIPVMESLTVKGNINSEDVATIGRLIKDYNLRRVDLTDADMKGDKNYADSVFSGKMFGIENCAVQYFALPKSIKKMTDGANWSDIDTLVVGSEYYSCIEGKDLSGFYKTINPNKLHNLSWSIKVKHLIVRDNVSSIHLAVNNGYSSYYSDDDFNKTLCSVSLPKMLKVIKDNAFVQFRNLEYVNLPDSLEEIGYNAFFNTKLKYEGGDTLRFPKKLKNIDLYLYGKKFFLGEGGTVSDVYISDSCEKLKLYTYLPTEKDNYSSEKYTGMSRSKISFHTRKKTPPVCEYGVKDDSWMSLCTTYVPVGSKEAYEKVFPWKNSTIIEDPIRVTKVVLSDSVISFTGIGESVDIVAKVLPDDADYKDIQWTSTNPAVCMVVGDGHVYSTGYGETLVIASSVEGGKVAVCRVKVVDSTGIDNVHNGNKVNAEKCFDLSGRRLPMNVKGVNVVQMSNGVKRKVVIK